MNGALHFIAAERRNDPLDLPPMAEARDVPVVAASLRPSRRFETGVIAVTVDEIGGIGQCDTVVDEETVHEKARISLKTVLEPVAEALGNTPAISRKSYVHPKLIDAARGQPRDPLGAVERPRGRKWLSSAEVGLLDFLAGKKRRSTKAAA